MPHKALWVNADATQTVKYIEGGYTPGPDELLIKTICVGLNPADYKHPEFLGAVNTVEGFDAVGPSPLQFTNMQAKSSKLALT
jgi:NADPH:quinone reductase-like Zn-dependent oxidoreductase